MTGDVRLSPSGTLIVERGDPIGDVRVGGQSDVTNLEVRRYARVWTEALAWEELGRGRLGVPRVVTHACGVRAEDGAWLDGPILVFGKDGSVVGAVPSGGKAQLEVPMAALEGGGVPLEAAVGLEREAPWRCLRALVAAAFGDFDRALRFCGGAQDLRAALVLFAARQAFPERGICWLGERDESQPWRRFLHNAGIAVERGERAGTQPVEPLAAQVAAGVLESCVTGAHRLGKVIPAALTRPAR